MIQKTKLLSMILLMMMVGECMAIPADPTPCKIQQPDGTFVTLSLHGDEYLHYTTTADGFTVVKDERGFWVYASKQADGTLVATDMVAHDEADRTADEKSFLDSTPRQIVPKMDSRMAKRRQSERARRAPALKKPFIVDFNYSKFRGLIILVEFNDKEFMYGDEMNSIMNDIANKENYKGDSRTNYEHKSSGINAHFYGSAYDYFRDNSNGKFLPKFDVVGPVKVNYSQYFADGTSNGSELAKKVVDAADPLVDFSQYDGDGDGAVDLVYIVYAGFGSHSAGNDSRLIWPHAWWVNCVKDGVKVKRYACSTEKPYNEDYPMLTGIGVLCHEFCHVLGLPDLYDVDGEESGGVAPDPNGWTLMAGGSWHGYDRYPCNLSLYERYLLGFCEKPTILNEVGAHSMREVSTNEGFWMESPVEDEFFIIENRQKTGWDTYLPGHGMIVSRVDMSNPDVWYDAQVNIDPTHMYYEPLFAGGNRGGMSPYDPFPGEGNVTMLTNYTSPNLRTWSGQECEFALTHIAENDGIISFDLVDASTLSHIEAPNSTLQPPKGHIYNLQGQRLNTLQKGLNIVDGKKVFQRE